MLTVTATASGGTLVPQLGLPETSLKDVLIYQNGRFAVDGLSISIYNLPSHGCAVHQEDRYFFIYRPQAQNRNNPSTPLQPRPAPKQGSGGAKRAGRPSGHERWRGRPRRVAGRIAEKLSTRGIERDVF